MVLGTRALVQPLPRAWQYNQYPERHRDMGVPLCTPSGPASVTGSRIKYPPPTHVLRGHRNNTPSSNAAEEFDGPGTQVQLSHEGPMTACFFPRKAKHSGTGPWSLLLASGK